MSDTALAPDIARARLLETVSAITQPKSLSLADCLGQRLAATLIAEADLPATANAAVDGYAIHAEFLAANPDHEFKIVGRAAAGHPFTGAVNEGEAVRIFTGAIMPNEGHAPNAVAMHEMCRANDAGTLVKIDAQLKPASNSRPAGENIRIGETLIPAGTRLGPADIGIAAAAGHAKLSVHRRLIVGVISMGDEIVVAGDTPAYGQSYDSNLPMLHALLGADGHDVRTFPIVPDRLDALVLAYRDAFEICDVVISSGGASDGDEDHTQSAIKEIGADLVFWRLAMKPGRPMAVGTLGHKRLFCLPGNPVAAFVCYRLRAAPAIAVMAGGIARPILKMPVKAGFAHNKKPGRAEYLRVRLHPDDSDPNNISMVLHGRRGAGVLSSLTGADGLVEIPVENDSVTEGDYLTFIPFREAGL